MPSPRYRLGGNFRKFGTDSYGISGTFCALAFRLGPCANNGLVVRSPAMTPHVMNTRFMEASGEIRGSVGQIVTRQAIRPPRDVNAVRTRSSYCFRSARDSHEVSASWTALTLLR